MVKLSLYRIVRIVSIDNCAKSDIVTDDSCVDFNKNVNNSEKVNNSYAYAVKKNETSWILVCVLSQLRYVMMAVNLLCLMRN